MPSYAHVPGPVPAPRGETFIVMTFPVTESVFDPPNLPSPAEVHVHPFPDESPELKGWSNVMESSWFPVSIIADTGAGGVLDADD